MDCFSSIFSLSFQDFYTIVLDELVLEVVARHRDDILAQPPDYSTCAPGRKNPAFKEVHVAKPCFLYKPFTTYITFIRFITSMYSHVCL